MQFPKRGLERRSWGKVAINTLESSAIVIEDYGRNHINDQERTRVRNDPTFNLDNPDEYAHLFLKQQ